MKFTHLTYHFTNTPVRSKNTSPKQPQRPLPGLFLPFLDPPSIYTRSPRTVLVVPLHLIVLSSIHNCDPHHPGSWFRSTPPTPASHKRHPRTVCWAKAPPQHLLRPLERQASTLPPIVEVRTHLIEPSVQTHKLRRGA